MANKNNKPEFYGKRFWVHQIFGLLGDIELPELFKINQKKLLNGVKIIIIVIVCGIKNLVIN